MIPDFQISLGGIDRTPALRPILSSISVIDKPGIDADSCDVKLKATKSLAIPQSGTDMTVWLGYRSAVSEVFKGVVNKIGYSGPPNQLFIQATGVPLSDDKRLQGSHTRSWNDTTLGAVFEDIIQTAGFTARVHDGLAGIGLKRLIQSIETDIEILTQLAKTYGGVLKSDGEVVAVVPRDSLERADGERLPPITITPPFSKYSWTLRQRNGYKAVVAFWQDDEAGEVKVVIVGGGEPELRLKTIFDSEDAARKAAERELEKYKARSVLNVSLPGQFIPVGSPLRIEGVPQAIANRDYQVLRVHHNFGKGYTISVEAEGE